MPFAPTQRLTVGVDLGDRWSSDCILGLEGETLTEGQLRTTQEDVGEFFQPLTAARVVMEVGTHSAWVREVVAGYGHEVLVANPRQMEGPKRRNRKMIDSMRIDWHGWDERTRSGCSQSSTEAQKCDKTW